MKKHKMWVAMLLVPMMFWLLLLPVSVTASAASSQNERIEKYEKSLEISVFYQKEPDRLINCFDVNEDGWFAIGYGNNTIQIYDSQGNFQYGYRFDIEQGYGIALKENNIVIYLARSDIAVEFDSTGKCIAAEKVPFSSDINRIMHRTHKQIGNVTYSVERDITLGHYSRLVKIDENKTKTTLYDATTRGYVAGVFNYILLSIFPIIIIFKIKKKINEEDRRYAEEAKMKEQEQ